MVDSDEFKYLQDNLDQWGLSPREIFVRRDFVKVENNRQISALVWGEGRPRLAMLHGGAQNAHTFDSVALALNLSLVALDLPHHGHSDASVYGRRAVLEHAEDIATALVQLAEPPLPLVGMSYGGMISIAIAKKHVDLASKLMLIDVTPGTDDNKSKKISEFIDGPESFANFDEIVARALKFNPDRDEESLRRGITHNAVCRPDGRWVWRYQQHAPATFSPTPVPTMWPWLQGIDVPVTLVRAMGPSSLVSDANVREFQRLRPHDEVIEVANASHSIQGSHPVQLAKIIRHWL